MSRRPDQAYPYPEQEPIGQAIGEQTGTTIWDENIHPQPGLDDDLARQDLEALARTSSRRLKGYLAGLSIAVSASMVGSLFYGHVTHEQANQRATAAEGPQSYQYNPINKHLIKMGNYSTAPLTTTNPDISAANEAAFINTSNKEFSAKPAWLQDFSHMPSGPIDYKDWNFNIGPGANKQLETYTNSTNNIRVENGALTIQANQTAPGSNSYDSASVNTEGRENFKYGMLQVSAKMPVGAGTWPAVWLLPANSEYQNLSPASDPLAYLNGGEMDMIEETGAAPNIENGVVHRRADLLNPEHLGAYNTVNVPGGNETYNTYTLLWTPTQITMEVNNNPFFTYSKEAGSNYLTWPFDQPFYLIANLAIGGSFAEGDKAIYPPYGVDNAAMPSEMNIKSIVYYPYTGDTAAATPPKPGTP